MRFTGLQLVFLTAAISGLSIFLNKFAIASVNPFILTTAKNLLVAAALGLILLQTKKLKSFKSLARNDWLKLFGIAIIGGSLPFLLFFKGLELGSAIKAAFLHKTMFIWVGLLAFIFLKEKLSKKQLAGALALFLGVLALNLPSFNAWQLGDTLILAATLFWAVEVVIAKHALRNLEGNLVAFSRMFFGVIILLGFLVFTNQFQEIMVLTSNQWLWIAFTALLLLGYVTTWYNGLKHINASVAASILLFGAALTAILETVYAWQLTETVLAGLILICSGLILVTFAEKIRLNAFSKALQDV